MTAIGCSRAKPGRKQVLSERLDPAWAGGALSNAPDLCKADLPYRKGPYLPMAGSPMGFGPTVCPLTGPRELLGLEKTTHNAM